MIGRLSWRGVYGLVSLKTGPRSVSVVEGSEIHVHRDQKRQSRRPTTPLKARPTNLNIPYVRNLVLRRSNGQNLSRSTYKLKSGTRDRRALHNRSPFGVTNDTKYQDSVSRHHQSGCARSGGLRR